MALRRRRSLHAIELATAPLDFSIVRDAAPELARGALLTIEISAVGIVGAVLIGALAAAMRTSGNRVLAAIAAAYAEFFRNTPPLVHIYFLFFALPVIGIRLPAIVAATLALILYHGGIAAEILRAGFEAVPAGQREAAEALGLSRTDEVLYIIAPQAFRISLPALGNTLIALLKNSALVSAIGVLDITGVANDQIAIRLSSAELYITIGIFYLVVAWLLSFGLGAIQRRLARYA